MSIPSEPNAIPIRVMKFGGTSIATVERIGLAADRVAAAQSRGDRVVVVVSAIAGETNRLLTIAREIASNAQARDLDLIAASGEQVTTGLMAIALAQRGYAVRPLLGHQVRIITDSNFGAANVDAVEVATIEAALDAGEIVVVAGFQGVTPSGAITTLGRGGSDTTAVAIAVALGAKTCEIYTDVDGVYTADPSICADARHLANVSFDAMHALAEHGAKVLHPPCVAMARDHHVSILVAHAHAEREGTWVTARADSSPVVGLAVDRALVAIASDDVERAIGVLAHARIDAVRAGSWIVTATANADRCHLALLAARIVVESVEPVARIALVGRAAATTMCSAFERLELTTRALAFDRCVATATVPIRELDPIVQTLHALLLHSNLRRRSAA